MRLYVKIAFEADTEDDTHTTWYVRLEQVLAEAPMVVTTREAEEVEPRDVSMREFAEYLQPLHVSYSFRGDVRRMWATLARVCGVTLPTENVEIEALTLPLVRLKELTMIDFESSHTKGSTRKKLLAFIVTLS